MTNPSLVNLQTLIDDAKCFEVLRQIRWSEGVTCPSCQSKQVIKRGFDETQPLRQRYQCKACHKRFDDLSGTILAGHHQPLRTWILCLYLMGLNLSNHQVAQELDLNQADVQQMTTQLRTGIVENKPTVIHEGQYRKFCSFCYWLLPHVWSVD